MKQLALLFLLLFAPSTALAQNDGIDDEKTVGILSRTLGGESVARHHLADLRRVAAATPYKALIIVGVSHQLLIWGWKESESIDIIKACANAAAGIGADDQGFARIATRVGQLNDAERSTYGALSSLELEGIPVWRILGALIGKTDAQTRALSSERRLKPRKTAEAIVAGFNETYTGAAEREAKKVKTDQPVPPVDNQASGVYQAEIVRTRLIPYTTAQGKELQKLLIDWKNTGTLPIGQVTATLTFFDAGGRQIDEVKNWSLFVTHDLKKTIKPGGIVEELNGDGFVVTTTDDSKAATAKAVLTKIAGLPTR